MSDHHHVRVVGDCVLSSVASHLASLTQAFEQDGPIVVDLSGVDVVDVSFIQLIVSASQTAARHTRPFSLIGMPDAVESVFRRSGIDIGPLRAPNSQI